MWTTPLRKSNALPNTIRPVVSTVVTRHPLSCSRSRQFHDYFVTHLPSSSQHPDSRPSGVHHKLPRDKSTPHDPKALTRPAAASPVPPTSGVSVTGSSSAGAPPSILGRDLTVVRIPLRSAKHHFGAHSSRCQRPYNEDAYQAGTIELPAFAKRRPVSVTSRNWRKTKEEGAENAADATTGDPQVFYFGVFDGHGGNECSEFLRDKLHAYIEDGARQFGLESSLRRVGSSIEGPEDKAEEDAKKAAASPMTEGTQEELDHKRVQLQRAVVRSWRDLVGGYFRRFKPEFFTSRGGGQEQSITPKELKNKALVEVTSWRPLAAASVSIETVLEWAFLKADLDFIAAQVAKDDAAKADTAINERDILGKPSKLANQVGGPKSFAGGSTCSIALISTPTPTPFWHPQASSTIITGHCGDTRILLCDTASGDAIPLTSTHHPSHPLEAQRMRRYAATFVTDSFGEERVGGLANTRAFGDMASKRIGVSAEPEVVRVEVAAAQYSFMVMTSDGVSNSLSDQEIVDIIKESRTPEQGAKDLVAFATEVTRDGDNATALVLRLGGWERRSEGGGGSMRTKEMREFKKNEALDPRSRLT